MDLSNGGSAPLDLALAGANHQQAADVVGWTTPGGDDLVPSLAGPGVARLITDDEGRLTKANGAAVGLFRHPRGRLLEMRIWELCPEAHRDAARQTWLQLMTVAHSAGEYQIQTADGAILLVRFEGIADFSRGLHTWLMCPGARALSASRPLDECPYERPFVADFQTCRHYVEAMSGTLLLHGREVASVRSCAHLEIGQLAAHHGGFYGRCALGDAISRSARVSTPTTTPPGDRVDSALSARRSSRAG